jgi:hypothetical protein
MSFLVIFSIICIFYKFQHIQHIFHILHIMHPHILLILQELQKMFKDLSDGWIFRRTCLVRRAQMMALQQCLPVPLDQHRLPVTRCSCTDCPCLPGLQKHIEASTHNAFKFGTALQKLALTYLLQYSEYAKKYAKKYAE